MFERGERIAICISGGKDSTVLAHVLSKLNKKYDYGLELFFLAIDEGIQGSFFISLSISYSKGIEMTHF